MKSNEVFVRSDNGHVVTREYRDSTVYLLKLLYLLKAINKDHVMDVATKFQTMFV